jgi:hypothetical protein
LTWRRDPVLIRPCICFVAGTCEAVFFLTGSKGRVCWSPDFKRDFGPHEQLLCAVLPDTLYYPVRF